MSEATDRAENEESDARIMLNRNDLELNNPAAAAIVHAVLGACARLEALTAALEARNGK
jgi:hypothetical protein